MPKRIVRSDAGISGTERSFHRCERLDRPMRRLAATIGVPARSLAAVVGMVLGMLGTAPVALGATNSATAARSPQAALASSLHSTIRRAGGRSGAYVLDLDTGQSLFSYSPDVGRLPASVEKLYTTSTALLDFGANTTLTTS